MRVQFETWNAMMNSMKHLCFLDTVPFPSFSNPETHHKLKPAKHGKWRRPFFDPYMYPSQGLHDFHFTTPSFTFLTTATVPFKFQTINLLPTHHQTVTTTLVKQRISLMIERRKGCSLTENLLAGRE